MNPLNVLTSFPHGVAVFDRRMNALFVNPAFREIFNISAPRDGSAAEIFAGSPEVTPHIERLLTEGQSYINHDFPLGGEDGKKTVALSIHTIDYGERETGACVVARENAWKNEMQNEREKEEKMAMLSMITAGLAHEIKNPLSGIRGAAQLMGKENESLEEYCKLIITETDRINSLVGELMDIGRERRQKRVSVNIHRILDDILFLREAGLTKKGIKTVRDYDPSLPSITAEGDRLKQTFINLIKNAEETMGKGGELRIRTRTALEPAPTVHPKAKKGMMMSVEISDTGKGIPPEVARHLFTPFNTGKKHGTGLGLVISLKIVRDHGGVLTLENNATGTGATARVLLPFS